MIAADPPPHVRAVVALERCGQTTNMCAAPELPWDQHGNRREREHCGLAPATLQQQRKRGRWYEYDAVRANERETSDENAQPERPTHARRTRDEPLGEKQRREEQ